MREPDQSGIAQAWHIPLSENAIQSHIDDWGYPPTSISQWFIKGPYHPFWHWWMVSVIDLKDHEGIPPANKQYPEAEYEFGIYSLDGEVNIDACDRGDVTNRGFKPLSPPDVIFHFHGLTSEQASEICEAAVTLIVNGQSCDSDFREYWKSLLARTVEHYTLGIH